MSLNVRAIATLGIGFGAVSVAYLGLWPVTSPPPITPDFGGTGQVVYTPDNRLGRLRDDRELLEIIPIIVEVLNGRR